MRERIEEESEKKSDALKALSKAQAELQLWRSKYDTDGLGRVEELEGSKQKISARLSEAEETIDGLNQKISSTEKSKMRLETELEELQMDYERVHAAAIITEKRGRNFDKVSKIVYNFWRANKFNLSWLTRTNIFAILFYRLSASGRQRQMICQLKLNLAKRNAETTTVSYSV